MVSIVVPTYNEGDNIETLLSRIESAMGDALAYEVIFVDDSTDDTPKRLKAAAEKDGRVGFLHRTDEKGLASAVVRGFSMARGDIVAVMDADLQHPPELLPGMLSLIESGADLVVPSRRIQGGSDDGLNFIRKFVSNTAKWLGTFMLKPLRRVSDPTGGFFMMRRSVIANRPLDPLGWKILMEVLVMGDYRAVKEIPYEFSQRNAGKSKMSTKVMLEYLGHLLSMKQRYARICREETGRR